MTKIAMVGRGTVGCFSTLHYLHYTDAEIDLIYDPNIAPTPVGEGTDASIPTHLSSTMGFNCADLLDIGGTLKMGIWKENFPGKDFLHGFIGHAHGFHFDATILQKMLYEKFKDEPRINLIESNVKSPDEVDADFVMMSVGFPKELDDSYNMHDVIPVNSAYITQCYWEYPRFQHTLTIARPYGWVFGIPLQKRCSIGYLFNKDINTLEEVQEDVKNIFEQFKLTPSDNTNHINFKNYSKKAPIGNRVTWNGNQAFFLEPLEATSLSTSQSISRMSYSSWFEGRPVEQSNSDFNYFLEGILGLISLHYLGKSKFNTSFWDHANSNAEKWWTNLQNTKPTVYNELCQFYNEPYNDERGWSTWYDSSWKMNIENLGVKERFSYA